MWNYPYKMSAYFNLLYEVFWVTWRVKARMCVAFNTVVRQIFKLSKYTSVHDVIIYIGSKPCDIILDERGFLLLQSCMQSACGVIRKCRHMLYHSNDVLRIILEYSVYFNFSTGYVRHQFFEFFSGWRAPFFLPLSFLYFMPHKFAKKQFICMHVCNVCMYVCMYPCMHYTFMQICIYICKYVRIFVYFFMYMCNFICIFNVEITK